MWTFIGPRNIGGRIISLAVSPYDPNVVYGAAETGGIWRTVDGAETWIPLMQDTPTQNIGALEVIFHPTNRDLDQIFAGTGAPFYGVEAYSMIQPMHDKNIGVGLLTSRDGGRTWILSDICRNRKVQKLILRPGHPTHLYMAGATCLERSHDGGATWETLVEGHVTDVLFDPEFTNVLFCVKYEQEFFRIVERQTWIGRIDLDLAGSDVTVSLLGNYRLSQLQNPPVPPVLGSWTEKFLGRARLGRGIGDVGNPGYLVLKSYKGYHWKTEDLMLGSDWALIPIGPYADSARVGGGMTFNALVVHPSDPGRILTAGYGAGTIYGTVPVNAAGPYHPDVHQLVIAPSNPDIVYMGNDGGVAKSVDGGSTYTQMNNGLGNTQIYYLESWSRAGHFMIVGTQDNGSMATTGGLNWTWFDGGDGTDSAIHPDHPRPIVVAFTGWAHRIVGNTMTPSDFVEGIDYGQGFTFSTVFAMDPSNPGRVLTSSGSVIYLSRDGMGRWWQASPRFEELNLHVRAIEFARANPLFVFAGLSIGNPMTQEMLDLTYVAIDGIRKVIRPLRILRSRTGAAVAADSVWDLWEDIANNLPTTIPCERLISHPTNQDILIGCFGGNSEPDTVASRIFITENATSSAPSAVTWRSISGNLPPRLPVYAAIFHPSNTNTIFIGTPRGVYVTTDGGENWVQDLAGLPQVIVSDLKLDESNPGRIMLYAATYGRGVYEKNITPGYVHAPVHIYMRDHDADNGLRQPSRDDFPHPFDTSRPLLFWESPDIKVDSPHSGYVFAPGSIDSNLFDLVLQHENPVRETANRVYFQVFNKGTQTALDVKIRAFVCDATPGLPPLPHILRHADDFHLDANPFWWPVMDTETIPSIPAGGSVVIQKIYDFEPLRADHACMLAIISNELDRFDTPVVWPYPMVQNHRHLVQKNLHIANRDSLDEVGIMTVINNPTGLAGSFRLEFEIPSRFAAEWFFMSGKSLSGANPLMKSQLRMMPIQDKDDWKLWIPEAALRQRPAVAKEMDLQHVFFSEASGYCVLANIWLEPDDSFPLLFVMNFTGEREKQLTDTPIYLRMKRGEELVGGSTYLMARDKAADCRKLLHMKLTLVRFSVQNDLEPFWKGKGEFTMQYKISFAGKAGKRKFEGRVPPYATWKLSQKEGHNFVAPDYTFHDGYMDEAESVKLEFTPVELDTFDADDIMSTVKWVLRTQDGDNREIVVDGKGWKVTIRVESVAI